MLNSLMLNINSIGYSYNDVTIIPSEISNISSRSECNPFIENTKNQLPIFASPMASVVSENNVDIFLENGITPILPRNIDLKIRKEEMKNQTWVALSLKEFEDLFINNYSERIGDLNTHYFIVVDIANGHMKSLYDKCKIAKKNAIAGKYKLTIMTGNIANPETYEWICNNCCVQDYNTGQLTCCIDFIRVGIGGGHGCITTSNTSIHYPQATLINECYKIKKELACKNLYDSNPYNRYAKYVNLPKIVADGGIRNYDHVIKALALGADYVMIGSLFAQCIESAGEKCSKNASDKLGVKLNINEKYKNFEYDGFGQWWGYYKDEEVKKLIKPWEECLVNSPDKEHAQHQYDERLKTIKKHKHIGYIDVKFFGMASADGQKSINGEKNKTAEGITKYLPVKYTLPGWVENMISYLRSAMSYTNCKTLDEFIGKPQLIINSISEIQAVNK